MENFKTYITLFIIGSIIGWPIIISQIIQAKRLNKFKSLFGQEQPLSVVKSKYFYGISKTRVIIADLKATQLFNSTFNDIMTNENIAVEIAKYSSSLNSSKGASFFANYTKYLKCEEYPQYRDNILDNSIKMGMPSALVQFIFGTPGDVKDQVMKDKIKRNLFYGGYVNRQNSTSYKLRVDIENDEVVGWKDL